MVSATVCSVSDFFRAILATRIVGAIPYSDIGISMEDKDGNNQSTYRNDICQRLYVVRRIEPGSACNLKRRDNCEDGIDKEDDRVSRGGFYDHYDHILQSTFGCLTCTGEACHLIYSVPNK